MRLPCVRGGHVIILRGRGRILRRTIHCTNATVFNRLVLIWRWRIFAGGCGFDARWIPFLFVTVVVFVLFVLVDFPQVWLIAVETVVVQGSVAEVE